MSIFRKILGLFRCREKLSDVHVDLNSDGIRQLFGQHRWPVAVVQQPRDAAYWRRRNRLATAAVQRSSKVFAAAVIDALQGGSPA